MLLAYLQACPWFLWLSGPLGTHYLTLGQTG